MPALRLLRWFVCLVLVPLLFLCAAALDEAAAQTACGGLGQRACCLGERPQGACNSGLIEEGGCQGDCRCRGSIFSSSGTCRLRNIQPCGGEGQRACCLGERTQGACDAGLVERGGCQGDCRCGNNLLSSSGTCRRAPPPPPPPRHCGREGERACCLGERPQGACDAGLEEKAGCIGDCRCANNALSSSGTCRKSLPPPPPPPRHCGREGERACCLGERTQGACDAGLTETTGCTGDCRCGNNALASSGTCRRLTACGGAGQRACCRLERATACDPGTVEAVSGQLAVSNVSCDLRGRDELVKSGNAWQCDCAAGGFSLGVCLSTRFDPTATCWLAAPPPAATSPRAKPALSLYVAGMNHSRYDGRTVAHRDGIEQLATAIIDSAEDPRNIVVAFSESNRDDLLSGNPNSCVAGDKLGPNRIPYAGQCVAYALEQRFRDRSRFTYHAWHWWNDLGGAALVTGSRWKVVSTAELKGPPVNGKSVGSALEVRLRDTTAHTRHVSLYMFHTGGDDPELKSGGPKHKSWSETAPIVELARQRMRPGDLAPLFVGDFNTGEGSHSAPFISEALTWWNKQLVCPAQPGVAEAISWLMEHQILHIFAGKRGGPIDFSCSAGHFTPVNLKYSRAPDGRPASLFDGIHLPNVAHNVVAMGFDIQDERPERCQAPELRKRCLDSCQSQRITCAESCAGPTARSCVQRCRRTEQQCVARCPR